MFKVSVEKFWPGQSGSKPKKSAHTAKKSIDYKVGYHVKYEWIDSCMTKQLTSVEFYVCGCAGAAGACFKPACFSVQREIKWPNRTQMQDHERPEDVAERIEDDKSFIEECKYKTLLGGPDELAADPFIRYMTLYADELKKINGGLHCVAASKVI